MPVNNLKLFCLTGWLICCAGGYCGLIENSPFIPPDFKPPSSEGEVPIVENSSSVASLVEFRGYYELDGEYNFLLFRKDRNRGEWLRLNEQVDTMKLLSFDQQSEKIQVNLNSVSGWIDLAEMMEFKGLPVGNQTALGTAAQSNREQPRLPSANTNRLASTATRPFASRSVRNFPGINRSGGADSDRAIFPDMPHQVPASRGRTALEAPATGPSVSIGEFKSGIPTRTFSNNEMPRTRPDLPEFKEQPKRN